MIHPMENGVGGAMFGESSVERSGVACMFCGARVVVLVEMGLGVEAASVVSGGSCVTLGTTKNNNNSASKYTKCRYRVFTWHVI